MPRRRRTVVFIHQIFVYRARRPVFLAHSGIVYYYILYVVAVIGIIRTVGCHEVVDQGNAFAESGAYLERGLVLVEILVARICVSGDLFRSVLGVSGNISIYAGNIVNNPLPVGHVRTGFTHGTEQGNIDFVGHKCIPSALGVGHTDIPGGESFFELQTVYKYLRRLEFFVLYDRVADFEIMFSVDRSGHGHGLGSSASYALLGHGAGVYLVDSDRNIAEIDRNRNSITFIGVDRLESDPASASVPVCSGIVDYRGVYTVGQHTAVVGILLGLYRIFRRNRIRLTL